jgi:hypothetical protein
MRRYTIALATLMISRAAFGQVTLATNTSPSTGQAGLSNVNVTASHVPSGTLTPANVIASFANTCGGAAVKTASANSVTTVLGSTKRVNVSVPAGLTTGTYYVTLADNAAGDANFTTVAGSCSTVQVTGSAPILNSCVAGSSMGVLLPSGGAAGNVTAYVPKGYWSGTVAGVFVKNIEGSLGAGSSVATGSDIINSCSSNPATGQTVCVANNTHAYVITGTSAAAPLSSASNTTGSFSGGSCNNCGVAVNAANNTAVINMGLSGAASNTGVQILNLSNNTFNAAFPMNNIVSENISVDPTRNLILSAGEDGNYTVLQIQANGSLIEYDPTFSFNDGEPDASAEDCSTGVAITPQEFSNTLGLVNLNTPTFTPPVSPSTVGTYTAPNASATLNTSYSFAAGLSGAAVAQGSGHLAVVTGEFGGNTFAVVKLPTAAGSGAPSVLDYAVANIPSNAACGGAFDAGFDPHTITAYTSPNDNHSKAVFAGYSGSTPICLALVDMDKVLAATRGGAGLQSNDVSAANFAAANAVTFFSLP